MSMVTDDVVDEGTDPDPSTEPDESAEVSHDPDDADLIFGDTEEEELIFDDDDDEPQEEDAASEDFDLDQYGDRKVTVKVDGEEQEVSLAELRDGYMRQADYTRKTQSVAEQRQRAEQYAALEKAFQADPQATLSSLARAYGVEFGAQQAPQGNQTEDDFDDFGDLDPVEAQVKELQGTIQQLLSMEQQREQAAQQAALDAEFEAVKTEHNLPDLEFATLINFAVDHQIGDLGIAVEAMKSRGLIGTADGGQPSNPRREAKRSAPPVEGGAKRRAKAHGLGAKPSLEAAFDAAAAELGFS